MPYKKQRAPGFKNGQPLYGDKPSRPAGRTDSKGPRTEGKPARQEGSAPRRFDDRPPRQEGGEYRRPEGKFGPRPQQQEGGEYRRPEGKFGPRPQRQEGGAPRRFDDRPPRQEGGEFRRPEGKFGPRPEGTGFDRPQGGKRPGRFEEGGRPQYGPNKGADKRPRPIPQQQSQDGYQAEQELPLILYGRNPVREALKSGRSIDRILVTAAGTEDGSLRELVRMARDAGVVVSEVTKQKLDEMTLPYGYAGKPANHQGIIARMPECQYVSVEEILAQAKEKGEEPFVIVLDSISDPHNLGSIMRSALCAGAHGVIIPKRRAASVTASAGKASAGAVAYLPVARVSNLSNAVEELKKAGLWICGADAEGKPMAECAMSGPLALVIGSEDEGIARILREKCDFLASIPMKGPLDSLNASVAAAVLMFEKVRQDVSAKCT